jgi:hypothetical protein
MVELPETKASYPAAIALSRQRAITAECFLAGHDTATGAIIVSGFPRGRAGHGGATIGPGASAQTDARGLTAVARPLYSAGFATLAPRGP